MRWPPACEDVSPGAGKVHCLRTKQRSEDRDWGDLAHAVVNCCYLHTSPNILRATAICRQCARPRARNVRQSGRVRAKMRLMSVFLFRIKGPLVTRMTSERCDCDVWTGTFAHEYSVNHPWSNLRRVRSAMCGVKCSHELCVYESNKSVYQFKPRL
jgi:hypothetical protein